MGASERGVTAVASARTRFPVPIGSRPVPPEPDPHRPGHPVGPFATPGLVLLAAVAVLEGYLWLHIIPVGPLRPSGLLFAVAVLPAAYGLTRVGPVERTTWLRRVIVLDAGAALVLGPVAVVGRSGTAARAFGVTSLVLAATVIALAVLAERSRAHRDHRSRPDRSDRPHR